MMMCIMLMFVLTQSRAPEIHPYCLNFSLMGLVLRAKNQSRYLRFNIDFLCGVFIKPLHVNLTIKMPDVANDGIVLHLLKVPVVRKDRNKIKGMPCIIHGTPSIINIRQNI